MGLGEDIVDRLLMAAARLMEEIDFWHFPACLLLAHAIEGTV